MNGRLQSRERGGVGLWILLLLMVVATVAVWHHFTGPWTEAGKTEVKFKEELRTTLYDLSSSYDDSRYFLSRIVALYREDGDATDQDLMNHLARLSVETKNRFKTPAVEPYRHILVVQKMGNDLYKLGKIKPEQLTTLDSLKAQIERHLSFTEGWTTGVFTLSEYLQWLEDANEFKVRADRLRTEFRLH